MYHRGIITYDELKMLLKALDVMPFWRERMIKLSYNVVPRRALSKLIQQGFLGYKEAHTYYKALGYSPDDAHNFVLSAVRTIGEPERDLSKSEILHAYKYGEFDRKTAMEWLYRLHYGTENIEWFLDFADLTRTDLQRIAVAQGDTTELEGIKGLAKGDIVDGYKRGLLERGDAAKYLVAVGVGETASTFYLDRADMQREQAGRDLTARQVEEIFKSEGLTTIQGVAELTQMGYSPRESTLIVKQWEREVIADDLKSRRPTAKPSKVEINKWLTTGLINTDEWVQEMRGLGYSTRHIRLYLLQLIQTIEG